MGQTGLEGRQYTMFSIGDHTTTTAIVRLRDSREYEGRVRIADGFVHFTGRRRVREGDGITYRSTTGWSWPRQRILEIRWLDDDWTAA